MKLILVSSCSKCGAEIRCEKTLPDQAFDHEGAVSGVVTAAWHEHKMELKAKGYDISTKMNFGRNIPVVLCPKCKGG